MVLVDGEHYPPVVIDAIASFEERGDAVVAAVMLGGAEKLRRGLSLGAVPIVEGPSQVEGLSRAIDAYAPDVVIDLSDAPVVDTRGRFRLVAVALARGVLYRAADTVFEPPPRPVLTARPSIAVIGTGKRTGKTAVSAALARHVAAGGRRPIIVAMGRGGPAEPVVTHGDDHRPTAKELLALADRGEHAASDTYEDAVVAGVTTVGARRAGAGIAGAPAYDTVGAAVAVADALGPDVLILEGSGTAIPPVHADATILAAGARTPPAELLEGLGCLRPLISDLVVVTMAEEAVLATGTLAALTSTYTAFAREVPIVRTVFRPTPLEPIAAHRVYVATTAPEEAGPAIVDHLMGIHGANIVGITHRLADRAGLVHDLRSAEGTYDVLLTEVKAAAIDVAARTALNAGVRVVFADNEPVAPEDDLGAAFEDAIALAARRAEERG